MRHLNRVLEKKEAPDCGYLNWDTDLTGASENCFESLHMQQHIRPCLMIRLQKLLTIIIICADHV